MKNRYKISEIAEIFGISRQTLIFYHKKDVLIPFEIDKDNGYRYYSKNQLWDLMFILTLKKAGFSLEEIKSFSKMRTPEENIDFLENKISEIEKRIEDLKEVRKKIINRTKNLKAYLLDKDEKIELKKERDVIWYYFSMKNPRDEREMVLNYKNLDKIARDKEIEDIRYINIIDLDNFNKLDDNEVIPVLKVGILIPENKKFEGCEVLEIGEYLTIDHKDSYLYLNDTYKKLDRYLNRGGYKNKGYSIEFIKEALISTKDGIGAILEIKIPVIKNDK